MITTTDFKFDTGVVYKLRSLKEQNRYYVGVQTNTAGEAYLRNLRELYIYSDSEWKQKVIVREILTQSVLSAGVAYALQNPAKFQDIDFTLVRLKFWNDTAICIIPKFFGDKPLLRGCDCKDGEIAYEVVGIMPTWKLDKEIIEQTKKNFERNYLPWVKDEFKEYTGY